MVMPRIDVAVGLVTRLQEKGVPEPDAIEAVSHRANLTPKEVREVSTIIEQTKRRETK